MNWLRRCGQAIRFTLAPLMVLIIAACSVETDSAGAPALEKQSIKVGILPIVGAAPAFLAKDSGLFAAEKIDVQFVTIQSSEMALPALARGELDIVFGNYVSFFAAQAKGTISIKFVADGYFAEPGTWVLMVKRNSKLRTAADISGKRVAVTTADGLAGLTIKSVLNAAGATDPGPSFVEMPYTDMGAALLNRTVDAALMAEPYVTDVAIKTGSYPLFDAASGPTMDIPISGYATTDTFASKHPNTISAFQRALSRGASLANADRPKVESAVHKYAGVDEQTAALMAMVGYPPRMNPRRLQRIPDLMTKFGLLAQHIEATTMILPSAMTKDGRP